LKEYNPSIMPEIEQLRSFITVVRNFTKANRIHLDEVLKWDDQTAEKDFWEHHDRIETMARLADHNINIVQEEYLR